jgi:GTP cyclohydrolase I
MNPTILNKDDIDAAILLLHHRVEVKPRSDTGLMNVYGVPRGGTHVAYLLASAFPGQYQVVHSAEEADLIVDDLIDSGATRERYPDHPFLALYDKRLMPNPHQWLVFPWEVEQEGAGPTENIRRLLEFVGENPARGGLLETPDRVLKAWQFWTRGYAIDPASVLKTFEDGAEKCDEMVLVRDIPLYSHCEHHMAAIIGTVSIAYIPNGKIVGLSKLSRLADIFARRLQVQERLTNQIADALVEHLQPKGVGVIIRARHLCMESRGVCQQGHHTVTSAVRGVMRTDASARAEFLSLTR